VGLGVGLRGRPRGMTPEAPVGYEVSTGSGSDRISLPILIVWWTATQSLPLAVLTSFARQFFVAHCGLVNECGRYRRRLL
jgi:hypothetical protein